MKTLSWHQATREQLRNIAFFDTGAKPEHQQAAKDEIRRRDKVKHQNIRYVEKGGNRG